MTVGLSNGKVEKLAGQKLRTLEGTEGSGLEFVENGKSIVCNNGNYFVRSPLSFYNAD